MLKTIGNGVKICRRRGSKWITSWLIKDRTTIIGRRTITMATTRRKEESRKDDSNFPKVARCWRRLNTWCSWTIWASKKKLANLSWSPASSILIALWINYYRWVSPPLAYSQHATLTLFVPHPPSHFRTHTTYVHTLFPCPHIHHSHSLAILLTLTLILTRTLTLTLTLTHTHNNRLLQFRGGC